MKIVVDANILFSALMKDSLTRKIIVNSDFNFCFPETSLVKIRKYKKEILDKSKMSEQELSKLLGSILQFIKLVSEEELKAHLEDAKNIIMHIDEEDVPFIAAALSQDAVIWSEDKHFDKQSSVRVLKTKDILKLLESE